MSNPVARTERTSETPPNLPASLWHREGPVMRALSNVHHNHQRKLKLTPLTPPPSLLKNELLFQPVELPQPVKRTKKRLALNIFLITTFVCVWITLILVLILSGFVFDSLRRGNLSTSASVFNINNGVYVTSSGLVGVNTASPQAQLEVM